MVAAMGREVVAVDAMADNLAYVKTSLELGKNEDLVTLVHNAISDGHDTLYPVQFDDRTDPDTNPGSVRVAQQSELLQANIEVGNILGLFSAVMCTHLQPLGSGVASVTLPDIFSTIAAKTIIMKMDIQGYESKVGYLVFSSKP